MRGNFFFARSVTGTTKGLESGVKDVYVQEALFCPGGCLPVPARPTMPHRYARLALLAATFVAVPAAFAQTGRISGRVTDARTGDELPGVNVQLEGTSIGAVSDVDGYFTIIGVRPGLYRVRASYVGYAARVLENVRVNLDQTTPLSFTLAEEDLEGTETVVVAERPVVEADVSGSRTNITAETIEAAPTTSVTGIVGLQAGAEGLSIRGSSVDEVSFNVNGLTLRDERSNAPYTAIPLASVQEVQVVTGGFNAEYGNVRSGLINVITKEGDRNRYNLDLSLRYAPPSYKNFDGSPNDPDSYWIRPYVDPDVAFVGTVNGPWDALTRARYPEFAGWNKVAADMLASNPNSTVTAQALYEAFRYQHRQSFQPQYADYTVDAGFGGPVPGLNRFGDTRFYFSFKRDQTGYIIPLSEDRFLQNTGHLKVTTDLTGRMKFTAEGLYGQVRGTSSSTGGQPGVFSSASGIAGVLNGASVGASAVQSRIFADGYFSPTRTRDFMVGGTFTHAVSNQTFYEVRATRYASFYDTNPAALRDTAVALVIGGLRLDEAPFGYYGQSGGASGAGVGGFVMGGAFGTARDSSRVVAYNLKADVTHQFNRFLEGKTGVEFNLTDSRVNYGRVVEFLPGSNEFSRWDRTPTRGALYAQTKLEFRGMIANTGLRLDYSHAGGQWYDYDLYDPLLSRISLLNNDSTQVGTKRVVSLSPRLGVSFPITAASKLFFNYGHFRSLPSPDDLYLVRFTPANERVTRIADPNAPFPKTIAYELGYEQSFFEQLLVRATGYYKNVSLEGVLVRVENKAGSVTYDQSQPNGYSDIRGFELSLERRPARGRWFSGFANLTYMVTRGGRFGVPSLYEVRVRQNESDENFRNSRSLPSARPVPTPYARLNLVMSVPQDFGPTVAGIRPLAAWQVIALGSWRAGATTTYAGGGAAPANVANNVRYVDYRNLDLRLTRDFRVQGRRMQLFADINNVFNTRRLSFSAFSDANDQTRYFQSLHLPKAQEGEYSNLVGTDRFGDFRRPGVAFDPITAIENRTSATGAVNGRLYYERATGTYLTYDGTSWSDADPSRVRQVLRDKAYIDMPNLSYFSFLLPRNVLFGLRINL